MNPHVEPNACLDFEPSEVHELAWLPLAVRHKLDHCGLRLSLKQWQALPMQCRAELLEVSDYAAFGLSALNAGAVPDTMSRRLGLFQPDDVARLLGYDIGEACSWLSAATPFARYALDKSSRVRCT